MGLDDAILQHGQAKNLYEKSPSITAQNAIERDLASAIERFKVKEELALDYEVYKRLKTKVSLVGEDIITKDGNATHIRLDMNQLLERKGVRIRGDCSES